MECILVHEAQDHVLFSLSGDMHAKGTGAIEKDLIKHVNGSSRHVLLDLSGLTFLASIGMRLFLQAAKTLANKNLRLILIAPTPLVQSVLNASAMDMLVPVTTDLDAARALLE